VGGQHVFISSSSRDAAMVRRMVRELEERGLMCWMAPRDVPPGANFGSAITEAIENAYAMVLVFSANADANAEEIKKEVVLASQANLVVVPARIENLVPSDRAFRYELSTRQWVDLFENWDHGIERLVAHLGRLTPGATASSSGPVPVAASKAVAHRPMVSRRATMLLGAGTVAALVLGGAIWLIDDLTRPSIDVAGTWQSEFGPVTLVQRGAAVTGQWQQAQGVGEISSGVLDFHARSLALNYSQTWNRAQGRAVFVLSPDGRTLTGTWTQHGSDGVRNGHWVMKR
jgi:hypothetical protein